MLGGRLAAAIAYYGFFAVFALALVGYSIFGSCCATTPDVRDAVVDFLDAEPAVVDIDRVQAAVEGSQASGGPIGIVGIIALVFTGIGWVEAIRSSQRLICRLNQQPGNLVHPAAGRPRRADPVFLLLSSRWRPSTRSSRCCAGCSGGRFGLADDRSARS